MTERRWLFWHIHRWKIVAARDLYVAEGQKGAGGQICHVLARCECGTVEERHFQGHFAAELTREPSYLP